MIYLLLKIAHILCKLEELKFYPVRLLIALSSRPRCYILEFDDLRIKVDLRTAIFTIFLSSSKCKDFFCYERFS